MAINKFETHQDEIPYDMVSRETVASITNPNALAIWVYLTTKPANWIPRRTDIKDHFSLGDIAYKKAIEQLKSLGLYEVEHERDGKGKIVTNTVHLYPLPKPELLKTRNSANPHYGKPEVRENSKLKEEDIVKEKESIKKKEKYPAFVANEMDKKIFDYRKSIKKPLKTERGLSSLRKAIKESAIAWKVTEFQVFGVMVDKEWQSINPSWTNPFSDNVVSISNQQKQSAIPENIKILNPGALQ